MRYSFDLGSIRFYIGLTRSGRAEGVCSGLPDGRHFLMWDFDDKEVADVIETMGKVQLQFRLPQVYIINTGKPAHFHCYAFKAYTWAETLYILASSDGIDETYFKIGAIRGFFTLRYTEKGGRDFTLEAILPSVISEDVDPLSIPKLVHYWTKRV